LFFRRRRSSGLGLFLFTQALKQLHSSFELRRADRQRTGSGDLQSFGVAPDWTNKQHLQQQTVSQGEAHL
jgi:hypothetical protein